MQPLEPRKQRLLRAIVCEYVVTGEPVASDALVQKYDLGVKAATVRNELAEMSELGYLEQPHTSAGRIPSDHGYRFFVDCLVIEKALDHSQRKAIAESVNETEALQDMLRDTVKVLSRASNQMGVATTIKDTSLTIRTVIVTALGPTQALLVVALSNGHVENRMMECPKDFTLTELGKANEALAQTLIGQELRNVSKIKPRIEANPAVERFLGSVWMHLKAISRQLTRGKLILEGEENLFGHPEFQRDVNALSGLLRELTESDVLYEATSPKPELVTIGKEHGVEKMRPFTVIRRSFTIGQNEIGSVAIVGPTRLDYDGSIPLINFTAEALSRSLTKMFG